MIIDMSYWTRVLKKFLYVILILVGLFFAFKLAIFYTPFLIAFIISLMVEPAIRFIMKKMKFTRKTSSIIIFIIVSAIIIGAVAWGIVALISEASNLLQDLNGYVEKAYILFQNFTSKFDFNKIHLPTELTSIIQNSTGDVLTSVSGWVRNFLTGLLNIITSMPSIIIYFVVTIMALYLICVDKVYILDQIEHHFPQRWVFKVGTHIKDLTKTLGGYLKAEATLILVSFIISLIGLSMLKFANFNIDNPIKEIIKDTKISVASAFKYPPNVFVKSFMCVPTLKTHLCGKWCSIWSKIYTLSTHIKYKAIIVTTKYIIIDGIDVIIFNKPVKKFLTHPETEVSTSPVEFWIIDVNSVGK